MLAAVGPRCPVWATCSSKLANVDPKLSNFGRCWSNLGRTSAPGATFRQLFCNISATVAPSAWLLPCRRACVTGAGLLFLFSDCRRVSGGGAWCARARACVRAPMSVVAIPPARALASVDCASTRLHTECGALMGVAAPGRRVVAWDYSAAIACARFCQSVRAGGGVAFAPPSSGPPPFLAPLPLVSVSCVVSLFRVLSCWGSLPLRSSFGYVCFGRLFPPGARTAPGFMPASPGLLLGLLCVERETTNQAQSRRTWGRRATAPHEGPRRAA